MPPPTIGVQRYMYCKGFYRDIHKFLANRSWTPTEERSMTSGVTWLELFILFDVTGARTSKGDHIKDPKAKRRADARNKKEASTKDVGPTSKMLLSNPHSMQNSRGSKPS